jgi:RNA polymerase sigma factor (TIGR02999 family)
MLAAYVEGDREILDTLLPLVYDELRRIAAHYLEGERADHTLQPTALVHEAYLRLVNQHSVKWQNRAQFYGIAANMMRRILVNYAVAKRAEKRGHGAAKVPLDDEMISLHELNLDLLGLDDALTELAKFDAEKARLVEMKFFCGMTTREIAEVMNKSTATVDRDWAFARTWLYQKICGEEDDD